MREWWVLFAKFSFTWENHDKRRGSRTHTEGAKADNIFLWFSILFIKMTKNVVVFFKDYSCENISIYV